MEDLSPYYAQYAEAVRRLNRMTDKEVDEAIEQGKRQRRPTTEKHA